MNFLDRAISAFAPQWGLDRAAARAGLAAIQDAGMAYRVASSGRRASNFRRVTAGPISEVNGGRNIARFVARDLVQNNPVAARIPQVITQNVVGAGIIPSAKADTKAKTAKLEAAFKQHFDTPDCDYDGRLDLYGLQQVIMSAVVSAGDRKSVV